MSETDDTDLLLLIPPNFFNARTSGESSCVETARTVVPRAPRHSLAALQATVGSLEHRVSSLELTVTPRKNTSISSHRTPNSEKSRGDKRSFTFPRRRRRKFHNKNVSLDFTFGSTVSSSCCEEIPRLSLQNCHSYSCNMDSELSSVASTPSKKMNQLFLKEIDEYLDKVDCYESPDKKVELTNNNLKNYTDECDALRYDDSNSNHVRLPSGRRVPRDFLDKYIYLTKHQQSEDSNHNKIEPIRADIEVTPTISETAKKEVLRTSARKLNFNKQHKNSQSTSTPNAKLIRGNMVPEIPLASTAFERTSKFLDQYKPTSLSTCDTISNISSYTSPAKDKFKFRKYNSDKDIPSLKGSKYPLGMDADLMSLSELWSEKEGHSVESAKLEEEKLKREHCEAVIHDLQKKVLELQEKIAVAVKVDRAKDNAICRLREAWVRVNSGLEHSDSKHKASLDRMNAEMVKLRQSAEEAQKKTRHFESEMYKTLDLAHDYQDKCKAAQKDKQRVEAEREKLLEEHASVLLKKDEELSSLKDNYESVMRLNKQLTDCLKNNEETVTKEKKESEELKRLTQDYQEEMTLLQQERDLLKEKNKEERARIGILERQLADAQGRLTDMQSREKSLETELRNARHLLEVQKEELKSHYQRQLEEAVMAKLTEFQGQLDAAERELEREANERDRQAAEGWGRRLATLEEQHKLEVTVLEEKHKEEMKLCRLQLVQANEKLITLENKLCAYRKRRSQMASQLHGVMESQWRQALDILTGHTESADQSHRSHSGFDHHAQEQAPAPRASASVRTVTDIPTDRRRFNTDPSSDNEIQHYVKMLLNKPPESSLPSVKCDTDEVPTSDCDGRAARRCDKPPWRA